MDTLVTIQLAVPIADAGAWAGPVARAFQWFAAVETVCSRFDPGSEVSRLAHQAGRPVPVSPLLFEALRLGIALAEMTGGAFDPAIGHRMELAGYDRDYRSGRRHRSHISAGARPTYREVVLDAAGQTVTLGQPILLDLNGLAKGLAVDLAAIELDGTPGSLVDAGGDVYAHGTDGHDRRWRIGVADPHRRGRLLAAVDVADGAVATSGPAARGAHHLDPRPVEPADTNRPSAVTVLAPTAVLADALSTAAAVLGVADGRALLDDIDDVEGLFVTSDGGVLMTDGFPREALTSGRADVP
jgi:thiamine biosynthesis lipoprotein